MPKWLTWSLAIGGVLLLVALDGVVLWRVRLARPVPAGTAALGGPRATDGGRVGDGQAGSGQPGVAPVGGRATSVSASLRGAHEVAGAPARGAKAQICGSEHAPLDTTDPFAVARYLEAMTHATAQRWLAALRDSDDTRERAAGLLLEGALPANGEALPLQDATRNALVEFAVGAGDPLVYAFAWNACRLPGGDAPDSACAQLSLATWVRLDADNAVPWLLLADKARDQHDAGAEVEAFEHASAAHRVDSYQTSLLKLAAPALPQDVSALTRWYLELTAVGIEAGMRLPYAHEALLECAAAGTTRPQCAALAEMMVAKATTLDDLGMGARVGALAGWPAARVAAIIEERDALLQALAESTPTRAQDQWSCEGVRLGDVYLTERVRSGELAAARSALQHSHQTPAALAQQHREDIEMMYRQALAGDDAR